MPALLKRLFAAAAYLCFISATCGQAETLSRLQTFKTAKAVQELSPEEADRAHPVRIKGVITYIDEQTGDMFVEDNTAGIFVFVKQSWANSPLRAGQNVTINGVTTAGDFSPCITKAHIDVSGPGKLPSPIHPSLDVLMSGREDGHWAEVRGVVRSGQIKQNCLLLNVSILGGNVVAVTKDFSSNWAESFIDSEVVMRGAIAQLHNDHRQAVGVRLMIPPGFLTIEKAAEPHPFSLPESSSASIRSYENDSGLAHRVRIRATVIGTEPGAGLYISGSAGNLQVQGHSACVANAGDLIDVVGFPGSIGTRPALLNPICRTTGGTGSIQPVTRNAEQVLHLQSDSDPSGEGFAAGMRDDMRLLRVEGRLLLHSPGPDGDVLLMQSGNKQFIAVLPYSKADSTRNLENGSLLQLVGVSLVVFDQYRRAESFRLLLRSTNDIVVLTPAPLWNLKNAFRVLGLMAILLVAAMFWVVRQTVRLRHANALLQRLSFQDGLTGIANRRKFDETLEAEIQRAYLGLKPVSLIMLDIDYFKALNDCYGHQRGDECLVKVGRALQSASLRASDLVARYGGEEFAIILPGSDAESAIAVAERIRQAIINLAISHERSPFNGLVSMSAGVSTIRPDRTTSSATLVALADRALYESKTSGRNRASYLDLELDRPVFPLEHFAVQTT